MSSLICRKYILKLNGFNIVLKFSLFRINAFWLDLLYDGLEAVLKIILFYLKLYCIV